METSFFARGNGFEKWVWIELTGFELHSDDLGVSDFLSRCGYVPDGISLLLYWPGIVLHHEGLEKERTLAPCECSYGGHPFAPERPRQPWTNLALRRLIDLLHSHGCRVYMSFFNMVSYHGDDDRIVTDPWFADKPYLLETRRDGRRQGTLHMLKNLADGTPFEDVLQESIVRALVDYGFDGLQIADGISSPRISLQEGDYSDDIVAQFLAYSGLTLPPGLQQQADGDGEALARRADWIWQHHRRAWIDFHGVRWERFFKKLMARLAAAGKGALFNSAWTRDPFEALYRYGVEYRRVAKSGVWGCMVEDVSPGLAILSERDNGYLMNDEQRRRVHYEYLVALMLNRAVMKGLTLLPLAGIHDTQEQWGVLEHMPTSMSRNVMTNLNTFIREPGGLAPVTHGPFFCLCDGLKASDWDFIRRNWEIGWTRAPLGVEGATLLWSDRRMDAEMDAFIAARRTPTHRLASELLYAGAPIYAVARIGELSAASGPLLVTNADLLPEEELAAVLSYDRGPVMLLGYGETLPPGFAPAVVERGALGSLCLAVRGAGREAVVFDNPQPYDFDARTSREPLGGLWTHPLAFAPILPDFALQCAETITRVSGAPRVMAAAVSETGIPRVVCKAITVVTGPDSRRVFIMNDDYYYNHPTVEFDREIASIRCLTKYPGYRTEHGERSFTARVPGRGVEAFDVTFVPRARGVGP